ncbi:hypothetical protein [Actinomadura citrea]|uniref:Uncharacterized protein n=1 Tax=Actinomadura citrea TaxID=46158 RepID=A0A7Y9KER5_9ACTN|nr:hypothetical protein [Actinomadura citrea]NYE13238.1 hypothetical protein [Actinomadura citrea]
MADDELFEVAFGEGNRRREKLWASQRRGGAVLSNHWDGRPRR